MVALTGAIGYIAAMQHALLVFLGGGLGATGRYLVGIAALRHFGPGFPYATMIVNVLGSLLMGLLIGWLARKGGSQEVRLFFATGLLGGFTTFSAFSLDVANLWERGTLVHTLGYTMGTLIACIAAVFVGLWLVRTVSA